VWVTRFRRKILGEGVAKYVRIKLRQVQKYYPDWHFTEIGIYKDHVQVHLGIQPKYSVSVAVETIKNNTSRALRERFQLLDQVYWDRGGIWSKGYVVSTVGITERSFGGTWFGRGRKTRDKRSLNAESTPLVKAGESMIRI